VAATRRGARRDPPLDLDLDRQYIARVRVPDFKDYLAASARRSARVRRRLGGKLDVSYGDTPKQTLDVFPAARPGAPVHVFIHGGYWFELDKAIYSHVAAPLVAAGATVVLPNYELCPDVRITDIVDQMRRAIAWVHRNIRRFNGDPRRIYVSGHSAGGHLAGMVAATDWSSLSGLPRDLIKGIAPLSGLFDITPHRRTRLQPFIRLGAGEARRISPIYLTPAMHGSAIVAVGDAESDLFHWQSLAYAAMLRTHGVRAEYVSVPDTHHFAITEHLADRRHPLTRALVAQMGL
jgi:arylformamidase